MKREAKDCINCRYFKSCLNEGLKSNLDKRQVRKLIRSSDRNGLWHGFYCKRHKFKGD